MKLVKFALLTGAVFFSIPVSAQTVNDNAGGPGNDASAKEIVVTALRGQSTVQKTAAAVTALSGSDLESRGITDVQSLTTAVPAVDFGQNIGQAHIAVRGIGSDVLTAGQDPRVAFYHDGVYIARPGAQLSGLYDVERIEVLKGPQGTLYGRNSTGGSVAVISRKPTDHLEGYLRAGYGNYDAVSVNAAVSGPLSSNLSVRLAGRFEKHAGYGKNTITGNDIDDRNEVALRGTILWRPTANLEFLTTADYARETDHAYGTHFFGQGNLAVPIRGIVLGGRGELNSRDIASDIDPSVRNRGWGVSETITYSPDWGSITSVTAYREFKGLIVTDIDGTSINLAYDRLTENSKQFSQELTVTHRAGNFDFLVGGLYFHELNKDAGGVIPLNSIVVGGANSLRQGLATIADVKTDAWSGYARVAYSFADRFKLSVGARYSYEKKHISDVFQFDLSRPFVLGAPIINVPPFPRDTSASFSAFTPSATLEAQLTTDVFAYVTYSQGFKSGGFVLGVNQPAYKPERIKSYEAGIKTTSLDGRLKVNLIAFHYDYTNLQVSQVRGQTTFVENAASAKVNGIEAELSVKPVPGIELGGNASYLDAKYKNFSSVDPVNTAAGARDLSGNRLTQAPEFSFSLYAEANWKVGENRMTLRGDYKHVSLNYFTPFNDLKVAQPGYGIGSASLKFENPAGWSVEGNIRNIGNVKAAAQTYVSSGLFGFPVLGVLIPPRTYGLTLGYKF